jgi:hypothetical protein
VNDEIEQLLGRLSEHSAERAARWLLWSVIARRLAVVVVPLLWAVSHLLR